MANFMLFSFNFQFSKQDLAKPFFDLMTENYSEIRQCVGHHNHAIYLMEKVSRTTVTKPFLLKLKVFGSREIRDMGMRGVGQVRTESPKIGH